MADPRTTLEKQVAHWEAREREALEQLRYAQEVLPKLRESLAVLRGGETLSTATQAAPPLAAGVTEKDGVGGTKQEKGEGAEGESAAPPQGSRPQNGAAVGDASVEAAESEPDGSINLGSADEAADAVERLIEELPEQFSQRDIQERLEARNLGVKRATLRSGLQELVEHRRIRVLEPGRGRRATVYGKNPLGQGHKPSAVL